MSSTDSKQAADSVVEGTWRGGFEMEEEDLHISKGDTKGLKIGADFVSTNLEGNVGTVDVFFGCRHEDHDWLYQSDMNALKEQGIISNLYTAFSRDAIAATNGGRPHKYVQDVMLGNADCSSRLQTLILEMNASVFICGDGNKMVSLAQPTLYLSWWKGV